MDTALSMPPHLKPWSERQFIRLVNQPVGHILETPVRTFILNVVHNVQCDPNLLGQTTSNGIGGV